MSEASQLSELIAETLKQRATNDQMPSVAMGAGLVVPDYEEGVSNTNGPHF